MKVNAHPFPRMVGIASARFEDKWTKNNFCQRCRQDIEACAYFKVEGMMKAKWQSAKHIRPSQFLQERPDEKEVPSSSNMKRVTLMLERSNILSPTQILFEISPNQDQNHFLFTSIFLKSKLFPPNTFIFTPKFLNSLSFHPKTPKIRPFLRKW